LGKPGGGQASTGQGYGRIFHKLAPGNILHEFRVSGESLQAKVVGIVPGLLVQIHHLLVF
jgi:hypothetical protein